MIVLSFPFALVLAALAGEIEALIFSVDDDLDDKVVIISRKREEVTNSNSSNKRIKSTIFQ